MIRQGHPRKARSAFSMLARVWVWIVMLALRAAGVLVGVALSFIWQNRILAFILFGGLPWLHRVLG